MAGLIDARRAEFEEITSVNFPSWSLERGLDGYYKVPALNRMWRDWNQAQPPCEHGHKFYCGLCLATTAPKCEAHGNPWYCGHCGPVVQG